MLVENVHGPYYIFKTLMEIFTYFPSAYVSLFFETVFICLLTGVLFDLTDVTALNMIQVKVI